jgi:peptidoglycan LD-endopeptidase LytH
VRRFGQGARLALLAAAIIGAVLIGRSARTPELAGAVTAYATAASPHDRYAARLQLQLAVQPLPGATALLRALGIHAVSADEGRAWLEAADRALVAAEVAMPPFTATGAFDDAPGARAWRFPARRGHRVIVATTLSAKTAFVDLFDEHERLASAASGSTELTYDVRADGDLVLRVQPPLGITGEYRLTERSAPSMTFPVQGATARAIQSGFGAVRDAGRRTHEGIDIFASRGTPVVAATDGWIGSSLTNGLGGKVVWVWNPLARINTYYAHLDRHAVTPGEHVSAGEVVGYVGSTGNARGGPPHLHFGIYAAGEGSVDPLPFVCGTGCARR